MFYTNENPNFFSSILPGKTRKLQLFGIKLRTEDELLIYFEQIIRFYCISILQYKLKRVILWKLSPEFGKFYQIGSFFR